MTTVHFNVSGISNTEKKTSLKNALNRVPGVSSVDINNGTGAVTVGYNEPANEYEIRNCIEQTGFQVS